LAPEPALFNHHRLTGDFYTTLTLTAGADVLQIEEVTKLKAPLKK
jgi:hypothetical protein